MDTAKQRKDRKCTIDPIGRLLFSRNPAQTVIREVDIMLIPHTLLDAATLQRLLEDFVTRDGTDNGYEASLEQRVDRLRQQMERGDVLIVFHPETGDTSLAHRRDVPAELLRELHGAQ